MCFPKLSHRKKDSAYSQIISNIGKHSFIGGMIAKNLGSGKVIYDALIPIAEERLEERARKKLGHVVPEHVCAYLLDTEP